MIQINDMFRIREVPYQGDQWLCDDGPSRWVIEHWQPRGDTPQGRWKPYTKKMQAKQMDACLVSMNCPVAPLEAFRSEALEDLTCALGSS